MEFAWKEGCYGVLFDLKWKDDKYEYENDFSSHVSNLLIILEQILVG